MDSGAGSRKGGLKTTTVMNSLYIHDAPLGKVDIACCHRLWRPVKWPVLCSVTSHRCDNREGAVISDPDRRASFPDNFPERENFKQVVDGKPVKIWSEDSS